MTTRADVLDPARTAAPVTGKAVAADFGRLLGWAFVMSLAVGLLLTAAAVAVPAPLACDETPLMRCERPADAMSGSLHLAGAVGRLPEGTAQQAARDTERVRLDGLGDRPGTRRNDRRRQRSRPRQPVVVHRAAGGRRAGTAVGRAI